MLNLIIAGMLASSGINIPSNKMSPGNLSQELYYASATVSGNRLCDKMRAKKFKKKFDKRFSQRIRELKKYHDEKSGADAAFIFTSSCTRLPKNYDLGVALDNFDQKLKDLEEKYGPP